MPDLITTLSDFAPLVEIVLVIAVAFAVADRVIGWLLSAWRGRST